jgi:hypothetical protein
MQILQEGNGFVPYQYPHVGTNENDLVLVYGSLVEKSPKCNT